VTTTTFVVHYKVSYSRAACGRDLLNCERYSTDPIRVTCKYCSKHPDVIKAHAVDAPATPHTKEVKTMGREFISIETDHIPEDAPCTCGSCDWKGAIAEAAIVEGAVLTPGDPSPCGRCPECDSLCYLTRPQDAVSDAAPQLLAAVRATIDAADDTGCDGCYTITADTMTILIAARDAAQKYDELKPTAADTSNAGKPWTAEEDAKLLSAFDEGTPIAKIVRAHKRTRAGIQARLIRLGRLSDGDTP
jgi:hypothetical protein